MQLYTGKCYKYRTFDSKKRLEDIIVRHELWFSHPTEFNDPYDCLPAPARAGNPGKAVKPMLEFMDSLIAQGLAPWYSQGEREEKAQEILQDREGAERALRSSLAQSTRVCSMSKSWRSLPQWAYYAANGSGLCLEFDLGKVKPTPPAVEVSYVEKRPEVDLVAFWYDSDRYYEEATRAITSKASAWRHEEEVRLFASHAGALSYPAAMLTRILVGQRASAENVEWLQSLVASQAPNAIPLCRVQICKHDFDLEQVPLAGGPARG